MTNPTPLHSGFGQLYISLPHNRAVKVGYQVLYLVLPAPFDGIRDLVRIRPIARTCTVMVDIPDGNGTPAAAKRRAQAERTRAPERPGQATAAVP